MGQKTLSQERGDDWMNELTKSEELRIKTIEALANHDALTKITRDEIKDHKGSLYGPLSQKDKNRKKIFDNDTGIAGYFLALQDFGFIKIDRTTKKIEYVLTDWGLLYTGILKSDIVRKKLIGRVKKLMPVMYDIGTRTKSSDTIGDRNARDIISNIMFDIILSNTEFEVLEDSKSAWAVHNDMKKATNVIEVGMNELIDYPGIETQINDILGRNGTFHFVTTEDYARQFLEGYRSSTSPKDLSELFENKGFSLHTTASISMRSMALYGADKEIAYLALPGRDAQHHVSAIRIEDSRITASIRDLSEQQLKLTEGNKLREDFLKKN